MTHELINESTHESQIEALLEAFRASPRFILTSHARPDGDALGSLLGMHHLLTQLGKDSVMFLAAKEFPLPIEYRFLPLEEVFHEPPADMADRTVVFLDCGNIDRMPVEFLTAGGNDVINIDHHHDNTRFGDFNLVEVGASCTAEIVYDLALSLGARVTREMAAALYVGLITDTGKFMYENTTSHTHRVAAELIDAGVDVDDTYRRLYEHVPLEKLRLISRALDGIRRYCGDRLVVTYITSADYEATGAGEEMTESDWHTGYARAVAVYLNGDAITEPDSRGQRVRDDSFLLLLNAHSEPITFRLPDTSFGEHWEVSLDTATGLAADRDPLKAAEEVEVIDRGLLVLRRLTVGSP